MIVSFSIVCPSCGMTPCFFSSLCFVPSLYATSGKERYPSQQKKCCKLRSYGWQPCASFARTKSRQLEESCQYAKKTFSLPPGMCTSTTSSIIRLHGVLKIDSIYPGGETVWHYLLLFTRSFCVLANMKSI